MTTHFPNISEPWNIFWIYNSKTMTYIYILNEEHLIGRNKKCTIILYFLISIHDGMNIQAVLKDGYMKYSRMNKLPVTCLQFSTNLHFKNLINFSKTLLHSSPCLSFECLIYLENLDKLIIWQLQFLCLCD